MRTLIGMGLAGALAIAAPVVGQDDPAALVIRVEGDVSVTHAGGPSNPAALGEQLSVGDVVAPSEGSRAILITRAGSQQVVSSPTTVAAPRAGASADIFQRAVATLAQAAGTDASTGGRQGMIRPIPGQTSLVAPRNSLTVATKRPTFRWTATPDQSYDLMLRNVDGGRPEIHEVGRDTTWTPPEGAPDLEAGATYEWTVFVGGRREGRALPPQRFRVIGLEESVDLEDYLDQIAVFGLDPTTDGLFLTVVAYRDMGLFYDASDALDRVEADGPLTWQLYRLKGEILAELGRESAAREAFDRADALMP